MANTTVSVSGLDTILNNNKSKRTYFSASASIFLIADLLLGNLFWAKYRYIYLWNKNWPDIWLVYLLSLQENMYHLIPFIELYLIFYLYQSVLVKKFVLVCSYLLNFIILLVLENKIYLAFGMLWILFLLGMGNFLQIPYLVAALVSNFCGHKFSGGLGGGL